MKEEEREGTRKRWKRGREVGMGEGGREGEQEEGGRKGGANEWSG